MVTSAVLASSKLKLMANVVIKALKNQERQIVRKANKGQNETTSNSALDKQVKNTAQLALTAPPTNTSVPSMIYMSIEDINDKFVAKVTDKHTYAFNTEQMSVIGEVLQRHISEPASYKRRIVSEFLNIESILNIPLNEVIQKFKVFNDNK